MKYLNHLTLVFFVLIISSTSKAQISLAPSFVFIDENSGVGNVFVNNSSDRTFEVSVNFAFGYPGSNAEGAIVMNYSDTVASAKYALDPMVRAFPRNFILKGGEQRTVRIQVVPKQRKNEGFYFTRMKVLAKPQTIDVTDTLTQGIGTQINFNFEQITAVFYHKGKVNTGLNIKNIDVKQQDGKLNILPLLQRTGNAPFLGSMYAKLKDAQGKVVAESQSTTTVYFEETRAISINLEKVAAGDYNLELSFETRRNDMQVGDLTQAPRILKEQKIVIQ